MKHYLALCCALFLAIQIQGQSEHARFYLSTEMTVGKTMEANEGFPKTDLQTGFHVSLGLYNIKNDSEWIQQLGRPKTGITLGYTQFGNSDKVGNAYSLTPFIEISPLKKWHLNAGIGVSYLDTQFDPIQNPFNRASTTKLHWNFRSFLYYDLFSQAHTDWRLGLGYAHHSNGHTRLPNQGLNSVLASISANFDLKPSHPIDPTLNKTRSRYTYLSVRFGAGLNVLSEVFNTQKPVYTFAMQYGKVYNKTFKLGIGFYYRFYQHYHDYIKNNETLVAEDYPIFKDNPYGYATNFGILGSAELLLGHVGIEFDLGLNIYKPFYKIDWMLNQGFDYINSEGDTVEVLGELDWYYEIKRTISSRLGLKYYLITTDKTPKHNLFIGAHINANLGQADFSDLSLGYVYRFDLKD